MRALNPLSLALVLVAAPGLAADHSAEFCAAWVEATAKTPHRYDDALDATWNRLGGKGLGGAWGELVASLRYGPGRYNLPTLRNGLRDLGESFACDAYEFPAGRPTSQVLLEAEQASTIEALAVDDEGLYAVATQRVSRVNKNQLSLVWQLFPKAPPRLLARSPWSLPSGVRPLLTPSALVVHLGEAVVSVARSGGSAQVLVDKVSSVEGLTRDGDAVVYVDGGALRRTPLTPGTTVEVARFDAGKTYDIAVSAQGFVLNASNGVFLVSRAGAVTTALPAGTASAAAIGPDLYFQYGSPQTPKQLPGLYRLRYGAEGPQRLGPWLGGDVLATHGGELLSHSGERPRPDEATWPGRVRLLRWKPGASAPIQVVAPVGSAERAGFDGKQVYWVDAWFGGLRVVKR